MQIRALRSNDLNAVKRIIDQNQMFPAEMLDDMTHAFLQEQAAQNGEFWSVACNGQNELVALAYCAPEYMTQGTWNLLLIAVAPNLQGSGIGTSLMSHVEQQVRKRQGRLLLVETSGLPDFRLTRAFYPKCGYTQVAVIPEFYDVGDDKVVFSKTL